MNNSWCFFLILRRIPIYADGIDDTDGAGVSILFPLLGTKTLYMINSAAITAITRIHENMKIFAIPDRYQDFFSSCPTSNVNCGSFCI